MNYRIPNIMAVFALVGLVMMAYLRWARPYQLTNYLKTLTFGYDRR